MSSLEPLDLFIIANYLVLVLFVGLWAGRRVGNFEQYAVADRSYSSFFIFATLSASFIGGGFTMGNAEKVFTVGIVNIVALWGFSLKEILVARYLAPKVSAFPHAVSVGDVMERDYGRTGKVVTGVFSFLLCAGILGAQIGGIGYIFNLFLGTPLWMGALIGIGIIIVYDAFGGMRAIVATDVLQFGLLAVGIPLALFMGIRAVGGIDNLIEAQPAGYFELFAWMTPVQFASLFLTFLLGETLVPPYLRRLFISRDTRRIARGTLWSGICSIPFFAVSGCIGLVAFAMAPELDANLALPYVIQNALPIGLRGLVIAGLLAIVMSSADSFLNSASIAVVNDIVKPLRRTPLSDQSALFWARATTVLTGSLALVFALRIRSLLEILIYAYNFWAPIILVPLVAALLGYRAPKIAFVTAGIAGLSAVGIWNVLLGSPAGFDGMVVGVFSNALAFWITCRLHPRIQPRAIDHRTESEVKSL